LHYDALHHPTQSGETVARAKRTQRADARRRYRAATAPDGAYDDIASDATPSDPGRAAASQGGKSGAAPARMGFADAFKLAIRPIHVREDLVALPWLAVHTKALWIPLLITLVSTVAIIATNGRDTITQFMFAYFIQTPAIGGVFIAGFLAPKASWLLGVIVGLVSAACYALLVVAFPSTIYAAAPPTPEQAREIAISAFIFSPIIGAFFAAAAAWYRRFLALSSPNRGRRQAQGQKQRPGDGRTRGGSTSQKAGAKR
jgi:hypothetical protein